MDHETVEAFNDIIAENPNASIKELKQAVTKNDSISGSQKNAMLKTLRHLENLDSKCIVYEKKNYHKIARQNNCDNIEEFITKYVTKETSIEEITQLAQNISSKEILILKAQLEKLGFDEKFIFLFMYFYFYWNYAETPTLWIFLENHMCIIVLF